MNFTIAHLCDKVAERRDSVAASDTARRWEEPGVSVEARQRWAAAW